MKRNRIKGFDGLRAIAIIGIIIYHAYPDFLPGGFLGVMAFFMIMGFLMVYGRGAIDSYSPVKSSLRYYKKKIKRIYPPLAIMLTIVILSMAIFVPEYPKSMTREVLSILFGYNNWWQIFQNSSYFDKLLNTSPLTHLWYIGLTVQYYLLWPILYIAGMRIYLYAENKRKGLGKAAIYAGIIALALISQSVLMAGFSPEKDPSRLYYGTDSRAFSLLTGMLIALLPIEKIKEKLPQKTAIIIMPISLVFLYIEYALAKGDTALNYHFYMPAANLLYAVIMICLLISQDTIGEFLEQKPFSVIGKYSYEMYLCMYPCLWFINKSKMISDAAPAILLLVTVLAIALSSFLLYHGSRWIYATLRSLRYIPAHIRRYAPALIMVFALLACLIQSGVSMRFGDTDVMDELATQLSDEQTSMNEDNSALVAQMRSTQLATVSANAEDLTAQIEQNLNARAEALAADPNAQTTPAEVTATTPVIPPVLTATAIGDSVMLGGSSALMSSIGGLYVDAAKNRRVSQAVDIVNTLASQGLLGKTVIIHLGTNGVMTVPDYQAVIDAIGTDHTIYWVNSIGPDWAAAINDNVNAVAGANENVNLIDWSGYAAGHDDWFAADHIHLTEVGAGYYASYIKECSGL